MNEDFIKQFLAYLSTYYGRENTMRAPRASRVPNLTIMPVFQTNKEEEGLMPEQENPYMAAELNGLFPGPYDSMRLN